MDFSTGFETNLFLQLQWLQAAGPMKYFRYRCLQKENSPRRSSRVERQAFAAPSRGVEITRMERRGLKKGGMKFQSPSVQNECGSLCFCLPSFSKPPLFILGRRAVLPPDCRAEAHTKAGWATGPLRKGFVGLGILLDQTDQTTGQLITAMFTAKNGSKETGSQSVAHPGRDVFSQTPQHYIILDYIILYYSIIYYSLSY